MDMNMETKWRKLQAGLVWAVMLKGLFEAGDVWRGELKGKERLEGSAGQCHSSWYQELTFIEHLGFAGHSSKHSTLTPQSNSVMFENCYFPHFSNRWEDDCRYRELKWFTPKHPDGKWYGQKAKPGCRTQALKYLYC